MKIAINLNRNRQRMVFPLLYARPAIVKGMYAAKKATIINIPNFLFVISLGFIMLFLLGDQRSAV